MAFRRAAAGEAHGVSKEAHGQEEKNQPRERWDGGGDGEAVAFRGGDPAVRRRSGAGGSSRPKGGRASRWGGVSRGREREE